jgi:response regulator RpfG family c-di-GMP phosphodiesterase
LASRILLTGYADKRNAIRSINEVGLYQYLEKPWDNDRLLLVLRNAAERSVLLRELDERMQVLEQADRALAELRSRLLKTIL